MEVLTVKEVKEAEARAVAAGLSEDILIENAAAALKEAVLSLTEPRDKICVLCGGGNNGADGLSLARMLYLAGKKVTVVLTAQNFGAAAKARLSACRALGVPELPAAEFKPSDYVLIVDAMLGTGCNRPLEGTVLEIAQKLNDCEVFVLSVDIPSGLNADTGETEFAVIANQTLTFSCVKAGHIIGDGRNYTGNLVVADIGIRGEGKIKAVLGDGLALPERKAVSHKYNYGRVRVVAGSPEMIGASLLAHESAVAALKSGAGLSVLCVPESLKAAYQSRVKEETLCFLPDRNGKIIFDESAINSLFVKTGAILIGPGMGENPELIKIIEYVKDNFSGTLVLDADALNAVAQNADILKKHKANIILTPHMGEFERLVKNAPPSDMPSIADRVKELAARLGVVIAAKSATTVISDGKEVYLNTTGTPALAKGGSGDVLGGMIAAFSCRMPPLNAAVLGCYHFGKCAEVAERIYGAESLLASNVIIK